MRYAQPQRTDCVLLMSILMLFSKKEIGFLNQMHEFIASLSTRNIPPILALVKQHEHN
jgi:hypothetical protein